jgi:starch-binding outer membrane protein, SusD/RagB family
MHHSKDNIPMKLLNVYITFVIVAVCLTACDKDLDIAPKNIITNEQVFSNESAIKAYLVSLYNALPIEDFNYGAGTGFNAWPGTPTATASFEAIRCLQDNPSSVGDGTWWNWWSDAFKAIRNVNNFLDNIPSASLTDTEKSELTGEAKFLRAYYYFGLVKRYGGVPIIKTVQNFTGDNLDELQVPRDKEKDVYDFIATDLDDAASALPSTSEERGRANKYVALALKSRALLFAASISKYGSVQLNGIVGIDASNANTYWQAAFNAAKEVINSGIYSLYNNDTDKSENFRLMFLDNSTSNTESIFAKDFSYPDKTHSYDCWNLPYSVRCSAGYSSRLNPTLQLCEEFEYVDGSDGTLKISDANGNFIKYKNATDLFTNKDPRFFATIIAPFTEWKGSVIDVRAGIIDNEKTITAGDYSNLYDTINHVTSSTTGMHIIGQNGIGGGGGEVSMTGFYARKYLNSNYDRSYVGTWKSYTSFIDMRLGEIYLNYAEAAIELGDVTNATWAINQIRDRAGIKLLEESDVTRDKIRHERLVELALEGHKYWDIRRWRIADNLINNSKAIALLPYYDVQSRTYIFKEESVGYSLTFFTKLYYEKLGTSEISKNPQLVQNPNY